MIDTGCRDSEERFEMEEVDECGVGWVLAWQHTIPYTLRKTWGLPWVPENDQLSTMCRWATLPLH